MGVGSFMVGRWGSGIADDRQNMADSTRGDSEKQMRLYRDAQSARFWSGVATIGGLLLASTGVVLLLVPEYNNTTSELFGMAPAPMPGGGGLVLGGRF